MNILPLPVRVVALFLLVHVVPDSLVPGFPVTFIGRVLAARFSAGGDLEVFMSENKLGWTFSCKSQLFCSLHSSLLLLLLLFCGNYQLGGRM